MMTNQEIFTEVARHLLMQWEVSDAYTISAKQCRYRAGALKCAVGALIADRHYNESMEGKTADDDHLCEALAKSGVDTARESTMELLVYLQNVHDRGIDWVAGIRDIAERYGLSLDGLEDLITLRQGEPIRVPRGSER